ncbi:DUF6207 family protein [Streptomyces arboris]|uniref:DUF6207 family protein n=1 Tax=Streptomyces arboris TaxID=2600619 RepID=UPI003C304680
MTSPIDPRHLSETGLVVLDITAADETTAHALMDRLQQLWATSGITPTRQEPGQPGVHAQIHAHIKPPHGTRWPPPAVAPASTPRKTATPAEDGAPNSTARWKRRGGPKPIAAASPTATGSLRLRRMGGARVTGQTAKIASRCACGMMAMRQVNQFILPDELVWESEFSCGACGTYLCDHACPGPSQPPVPPYAATVCHAACRDVALSSEPLVRSRARRRL